MSTINEVLALEPAAVEALTYESARDYLDLVVTALEDSELPLAELMKLWAVGEQIAKVCENHLALAAKQIEGQA